MPPDRGSLQWPKASIELYWLPLGAGGWFVRLNGRIWEAIHAQRKHRRPLDLYHTALIVRVPEGRFVVENCWPIPNADGPAPQRAGGGAGVEPPAGPLADVRYESAAGETASSPNAGEAVASPQLLSQDSVVAHRLLDLVGSLPNPVWGPAKNLTPPMVLSVGGPTTLIAPGQLDNAGGAETKGGV
jgi:hypothetical protein